MSFILVIRNRILYIGVGVTLLYIVMKCATFYVKQHALYVENLHFISNMAVAILTLIQTYILRKYLIQLGYQRFSAVYLVLGFLEFIYYGSSAVVFGNGSSDVMPYFFYWINTSWFEITQFINLSVLNIGGLGICLIIKKSDFAKLQLLFQFFLLRILAAGVSFFANCDVLKVPNLLSAFLLFSAPIVLILFFIQEINRNNNISRISEDSVLDE